MFALARGLHGSSLWAETRTMPCVETFFQPTSSGDTYQHCLFTNSMIIQTQSFVWGHFCDKEGMRSVAANISMNEAIYLFWLYIILHAEQISSGKNPFAQKQIYVAGHVNHMQNMHRQGWNLHISPCCEVEISCSCPETRPSYHSNILEKCNSNQHLLHLKYLKYLACISPETISHSFIQISYKCAPAISRGVRCI